MEAQATSQFRVSGINLQDLQDLTSSTLRHLGIAYASAAMLSISAAPCHVSGKEDKNVNCTNVSGDATIYGVFR